MVGRMISHLRFRAMRAYSLILRCRNSTLIESLLIDSFRVGLRPDRRAVAPAKQTIYLQRGESLSRLIRFGKIGAQVKSIFNLAAGSALIAFRGEDHAQMKVKRRTRSCVVS